MRPSPHPGWDALVRLSDRFWSRVNDADLDWCWEWTGARNSKAYGRFEIAGKRYAAHRVAYYLVGNDIPDGMQLDHLCRNHGCVNPAHLEPVTSRENTLRGQTLPAMAAAKNECPKGHVLDGKRGDGSRYCLACNRARNLGYYHANPEAQRARKRVPVRAALEAKP